MLFSTWAGRNAAAVALTLAYTIVGPNPQIVAAMERVYAVAIIEDERTRRGRHRAPTGNRPSRGPRNRRPLPARP